MTNVFTAEPESGFSGIKRRDYQHPNGAKKFVLRQFFDNPNEVGQKIISCNDPEVPTRYFYREEPRGMVTEDYSPNGGHDVKYIGHGLVHLKPEHGAKRKYKATQVSRPNMPVGR